MNTSQEEVSTFEILKTSVAKCPTAFPSSSIHCYATNGYATPIAARCLEVGINTEGAKEFG